MQYLNGASKNRGERVSQLLVNMKKSSADKSSDRAQALYVKITVLKTDRVLFVVTSGKRVHASADVSGHEIRDLLADPGKLFILVAHPIVEALTQSALVSIWHEVKRRPYISKTLIKPSCSPDGALIGSQITLECSISTTAVN